MTTFFFTCWFFFLSFSLFAQETTATFSHESEVSIVVAGGNSDLETYNAKMTNQYESNKNSYRLGGHYTYGSANDVPSAQNWDASLRYDRTLSRHFAVFLGEQVEGNKYAGYDERYNTDLGGTYKFLSTKDHKVFMELGYRYAIEQKTTGEEERHNKGRLYLETNNKYQENLFFKFWAEYTPNLADSRDYLITFEPSLSATLTTVFSLKFSYKGVYDNDPAGEQSERFDFTYTTSLLARF